MCMNKLVSQAMERPASLVLVSEISSRVVNEYTQAIAFIRLSTARLASAEGREILVEAAEKLLRFAEAHRVLQRPQRADSIDLSQYLTRVCKARMAAGLRERGVELQLSCEAIHLDAERCWRMALIVSELINVSVRHGLHGASGKVAIDVAEDRGHVICRISDDGVADPGARTPQNLMVIRAIAAELNGDVAVPFGATAFLTFPIELKETNT